jgi:hypothetical protein
MSWWTAYFAELSRVFHGEKWTMSAAARDRYGLNWIHGMDGAGLSRDPGSIHTGKNSGYQAISLAVLFGATKIYLLGFDFQRAGGRTHWHGDHPRGLGNGGNYPSWVAAMNVLARDLQAAGIEVINCSRKSAIECFKKKTMEELTTWPLPRCEAAPTAAPGA